jgi:hypothetical protein
MEKKYQDNSDYDSDYDYDVEERQEKEKEENDAREKKYEFKTNIDCGLSNVYIKPDNTFQWKPPEKSGLENCNYIIQLYYNIHNNYKKSFSLDYLAIIKDDMKNYRKLNKFQLDYIKELNDADKNDIIDIYFTCMNSLIDNVCNEK